jgi:hypothetical protein
MSGTNIETGVRVAERQHISRAEFDVAEALGVGFRCAELDEAFGEIDRDNLSFRSHGFGGGQSRSAAPAADIENHLALAQAKALDGPPPEAMPERTDGMVEIVRRRVVSRGGLGFC